MSASPAGPAYHFITRWRVRGTVAEVHAILGDAVDLARWWPAVYLDVRLVEPGEARGVGARISLHTKGWLPYTLRWELRVLDVHPAGFTIEALGDFVGRGVWTLAQAGDDVDIVYDWNVVAVKPLLRTLTPFIRPIFAANHEWAMREGEAALKLELLRRRARDDDERRAIAPARRARIFGASG
jgi:hypothetical protein